MPKAVDLREATLDSIKRLEDSFNRFEDYLKFTGLFKMITVLSLSKPGDQLRDS